VTPGAPGLEVDAAAATEAVAALVGAPEREAPLPATSVPPAVGPEQAQATGIGSLLGTFTTYFTAGQPRARNIQTIARVVDDTYVAPGELFSLNGVAGPRTRAKGYVADGAIINGQLEDVVGGGVSQFATTLFNAAFFAGLPIEQHKPHSFYISRYPAGRESTVNYGSIDVRIRNDTARGMVVKTWSTARSVTVGIYGDNGGRTVTSTSGPRRPRSGGGFTIEVTRTVTGGDGRGGTRVFRTSYNPPPD
jgi:vancomycin resistance protein YoaR